MRFTPVTTSSVQSGGVKYTQCRATVTTVRFQGSRQGVRGGRARESRPRRARWTREQGGVCVTTLQPRRQISAQFLTVVAENDEG